MEDNEATPLQDKKYVYLSVLDGNWMLIDYKFSLSGTHFIFIYFGVQIE